MSVSEAGALGEMGALMAASNGKDRAASPEAAGKLERKRAWSKRPCGDENQSMVRKAAEEDGSSLMVALLECGVALGYVGSDGTTSLMEAAKCGNVDAVGVLLAAGADAFAVDEDGRSAAMWAAWSGGLGGVAMLEALARAGARLDAADNAGETALMRACARGCSTCVEYLAKAGCDPSRQREDGGNALMLAVAESRYDCIDLLIAAKCRLDDADKGGQTALMRAAVARGFGDARAIDAIARAGANLDAMDENGRTALALAAYRGNDVALASLLAHGANPSAGRDKRSEALVASFMKRNEGCAARLLSVAGPGAERELDLADKEWRVLARDARSYDMESIGGVILAMLEARELRRASLGAAPKDSRRSAGGKPKGAKRM